MNRSLFFWISAWCALAAFAPSAVISQARSNASLQDAERARAQKEMELREAELKRREMLTEERGVLSTMDKIDRRIASMQTNVLVLRSEIESLKREIAATEATIGLLVARRMDRRELVADRLRANYKLNYLTPNGHLNLAFRTENVSDMLVRLRYLAKIREKDEEVIAAYMDDEMRLKEERNRLTHAKDSLVTEHNVLKAEQTALGKERRQRESTLAAIRKNRRLQENAIAEYRRSIQELNALITRLERLAQAENRSGGASGGPPSTRTLSSTEEVELAAQTLGKLTWPVQGQILTNVSPALEGVTIRAPEGTPIKAVKDGSVEYAEWFNGLGFGKLVVINHGNGYRSFYAHLLEFQVKKGDRVKTGQTIGTVGSTGSLVGSALYFEMRRNFNVINFQRIAR